MEKISQSIKRRVYLLVVCIVVVLIFGFKGNGHVNYYGQDYSAGSVFSPTSYTALFKTVEKDINQKVSEKRQGSLVIVLISSGVAGITFFSLWREDEFKDLLIELREQGADNEQ